MNVGAVACASTYDQLIIRYFIPTITKLLFLSVVW